MERVNPILERMYKNNPHYIHAVEVEYFYELDSVIEAIYDDFIREYPKEIVDNFIGTLAIHILKDEDEIEFDNLDTLD